MRTKMTPESKSEQQSSSIRKVTTKWILATMLACFVLTAIRSQEIAQHKLGDRDLSQFRFLALRERGECQPTTNFKWNLTPNKMVREKGCAVQGYLRDKGFLSLTCPDAADITFYYGNSFTYAKTETKCKEFLAGLANATYDAFQPDLKGTAYPSTRETAERKNTNKRDARKKAYKTFAEFQVFSGYSFSSGFRDAQNGSLGDLVRAGGSATPQSLSATFFPGVQINAGWDFDGLVFALSGGITRLIHSDWAFTTLTGTRRSLEVEYTPFYAGAVLGYHSRYFDFMFEASGIFVPPALNYIKIYNTENKERIGISELQPYGFRFAGMAGIGLEQAKIFYRLELFKFTYEEVRHCIGAGVRLE